MRLQEAIARYEKFEDLRSHATVLNNLSMAYRKNGDYASAAAAARRSAELFGYLGDRHRQAQALINAAAAHTLAHADNHAYYALVGAARLWERADQPLRAAKAWKGAAAALGRLRNLQGQTSALARAARLYEAGGDRERQAAAETAILTALDSPGATTDNMPAARLDPGGQPVDRATDSAPAQQPTERPPTVLAESLTALTAAAGTALATAAGTDSWTTVRNAISRLIARDGGDAADTVRSLDEASATLHEGPGRSQLEAAVARAWGDYLAGLLSGMTPAERELAVADLRAALDEPTPAGSRGDRSSGAGQVNVTVIGGGSAQMPVLGSGSQRNIFGASAPRDGTDGN